MVGHALGHYRVESELGAGGMGVVYEATDTRLGRQVAIKLLHPSVVQDAERLARFEREARVLASLNHPNIAAIHGLEEAAGTKFLVLEYVPGETLADRLERGPLPLKDALDTCRQIAEGLDAAHEKGIVHRDLKPANIKITPDGKVKVLDFGLAKAVEAISPLAGEESMATMTADMTRAGLVVGTTAYMSPEQACGKPVDRRTDVWAFGCVLFETLTRRRTFRGETMTEVLAAVIEKEPEWAALPATLPPSVISLLHRCLSKDKNRRLRDIGDARLDLEEALTSHALPVAAPAAHRRAWWPALVVGLAILAAGTGAWAWLGARPAPDAGVVRFAHQLPAGQRLTPGWNPGVMFSPDGTMVAFDYEIDGVQTPFVRTLDTLDQKALGSGKHLAAPVFSPDGRWVAMFDTMDLGLKKMAVSGGAAVPLVTTDMFGRGDWGRDGYIYFTDKYPGAIERVSENGGVKEPVTILDAPKKEFTHRHGQLLPGGKAIVFTVVSAGMESYNDARIELQTLDTKQRKILVQRGFAPRYSPSGHIVYANAGSLYAVPFNLRALETTGLPVKVVDGVLMSTNTGAAYFDIAANGSLAYVPGRAEGGARTLVWVDRHGNADPLPLEPRSFLFPRIAPDGKTIVVEVEGATHNLYSYDLTRPTVLTQLTTDGLSHAPVWTPDGRNICYRSWKAGTMTMWEMPADQSREGERLTTVGSRQSPVSVSPDGRYLAYNQMADMPPSRAAGGGGPMASGGESMGTGGDIWMLPLVGSDRAPKPFKQSTFDEASPRFSPNGKWVAYCSNRTGRSEVYVEPWPGPGMRIQLTSDGGTDPIFRRDGKEIFYRNGDLMMSVAVSTEGQFSAGTPAMLWRGHYSLGLSSSCGPPGVNSSNYDVTADGQRFLMVRDESSDAGASQLVVVLHWSDELKRTVAPR